MRHAAHGLLPHTLAGRMPGVALNAEGRAQAERLAEWFARKTVDAVVSSPVQRALETAGPIADGLGLVVNVEAGFEEIDFGAWTGRRFDQLDGEAAWARWNRVRSVAGCPGGETMLAAQARAVSAMERLAGTWPSGAVVVVSHSDVVKAVLAAGLGFSLDRYASLSVDTGTISVVAVENGGWRVDAVNLPPKS